MIEFDTISVRFQHKKSAVDAVKNVSFRIEKGEIFGIVGTSGAGKSTLLRTINLLQRPTSGRVLIDGHDVTHLQGDALRTLRISIGMIFQQFNLIHTKTVFENVAFAMKVAGKSSAEISTRVYEALELVGLTDKASVYPSTLSGGQKQRVGIARGIVNNPQILLCDEATSALDLETTDSILALLQEINRRLGITIVLITHEMEVVKKIANRVAVMSGGELLELGDVFSVFASPLHPFTQSLVNRTLNLDLPTRIVENCKNPLVKIVYNGDHAEHAIISETVQKFNIDLNILHGKIEYIGGKPFGVLVVQIVGEHAEAEQVLNYLKEKTYKVEVLHG
ncbi:MAG: ATP-binding cassette domain-containing protein [Bacteroidales bacterium]|jgi:D-methionine transport system ATP-binding protein|nr:ATP-binding cassette domain-containing protein [Bacteroidales bacterium]